MGKKGNQKRKQAKRVIRMVDHLWKEDEFGELKFKITKAEARRRFLREHRVEILNRVINHLIKTTKDSFQDRLSQICRRHVIISDLVGVNKDRIQQIEDNRIFKNIQ